LDRVLLVRSLVQERASNQISGGGLRLPRRPWR